MTPPAPPTSPHRPRQVVDRSPMVEFIAQIFADDGADEEEGGRHRKATLPNDFRNRQLFRAAPYYHAILE